MKHIVTCHTAGCANEEVGVELIDPAQVVLCGPCQQIITDIEPPLPDEPYEAWEEPAP